MIDLRSDTLTRPTADMRRAMAAADVGDDVYGEDPTVRALEERVAALFGKEAGLFTVTGSLANLLGIWLDAAPGEDVVCDPGAHIVRAELGAHAALHGITTRTWAADPSGRVDVARVAEVVAPDAGPYLVRTAALEVENTHNFGGGTVQPLEALREVRGLADALGLRTHLDGARVWNAHVASGVALEDYGRLFDTVSVCFSKGLGAPVGSMLLASADEIARARVQRKRLGAGWRQAGLLAAAADFAVTHHVDRLAEDHAAALTLAEEIAAAAPGAVDVARVETNIVVIATGERRADDVIAAAAEQGVLVGGLGATSIRAVTHLDVTLDDCRAAGRVVGALLA